jgi:NitT/TauT family transport system permease protein
VVLILRLSALTGLVAVLETATGLGWISPLSVARPSTVVERLWEFAVDGTAVHATLLTFGATLVAALIAIAVGVSLGVLLYRFQAGDRAFRGWIAAVAAAPLVLLYPLFLVVLGRNYGTVVAMGAIAGIPPIVLKTRDGLYGIRPVIVNVGRSFGATPSFMFWKILVPAAAPTIVNGIRVGLIFSLVNVVAVEFLINFGGLGQLVGDMSDRFDMPGVYSAILLIVLVSGVFFAATERLERWLRPE